MTIIEFLDWVVRAGGVVALLVGALGYMFREKWKQILKRSLAEDLERLKSELSKSQAEHAASLAPQLELIKHDFQQKLEAYKVTLIAETEAIKAKGDLRKSIALRYVEIEFERLVALEHAVAPISSNVLSVATIDIAHKSEQHISRIKEQVKTLVQTYDEAGMFLTSEDTQLLLCLRRRINAIAFEYVGPTKPSITLEDALAKELIDASAKALVMLRMRIQSLGKL